MNKPLLIFGYGSLMSKTSLLATVPTAKSLRAAYIKGFRRNFNKLDEIGFKSTNLDLAGIPYCAVNILAGSTDEVVNGIVFDFDEDYFEDLKEREVGYEVVETTAYDYRTGIAIGQCLVFSAPDCDGVYETGNPAQQRYLQTCLDGAKEYGEAFYRQFLTTTYVNDTPLDEVPGLSYHSSSVDAGLSTIPNARLR